MNEIVTYKNDEGARLDGRDARLSEASTAGQLGTK